MNVRLVLERNRKRIWTALLSKAESTIGRAVGNTVRIPSKEVSRTHCRLCIENGVVTVEDLESVNGTYINGIRARGTQLLSPGDRLTLGPATFVVEYEMMPEVVERLRNNTPPESDCIVLQTDEDVAAEVLSVEPAEQEEPVEMVEPVDTDLSDEDSPLPVASVDPVHGAEMNQDVFVFDDDSQINLPEGGDLREFLIELDDTDERPRKRKK
jgi:pSer/pThr/pTyr-binding forkhead associated (FHA) protein